MAKTTQSQEKHFALYTAYLNKLKELGPQAHELPKKYIIGLIIPEFFLSLSRAERIINEMVRKDLNLESLNIAGQKRETIKKILNKYFTEESE